MVYKPTFTYLGGPILQVNFSMISGSRLASDVCRPRMHKAPTGDSETWQEKKAEVSVEAQPLCFEKSCPLVK